MAALLAGTGALAAVAGAGIAFRRRRRRQDVKVWLDGERLVVTEYRLGTAAEEVRIDIGRPTLRWAILGDDDETPQPLWYPGNGNGSSPPGAIVLKPGSREVLFEFLQPPRHTEAEISAMDAAAKWPVRPGTQLMLDNRYMRAWDFRLPDGMKEFCEERASAGVHQHTLDNFFLVLEPGRLHFHKRIPESGNDGLQYQGVLSFGRRPPHLNLAQWQEVPNGGWRADGEPQSVHAVTNAQPRRQWREYYVELK